MPKEHFHYYLNKILLMKKRLFVTGGIFALAATALLLKSKRTIPRGLTAVENFDKAKYLGKWFEIARLDHRFEKNQTYVTAQYDLNNDGSIKVTNSGFDTIKNKERSIVGKARFVKDEHTGMLEVSFFGPFYSGYNVIAIDKDYKYALVAGKNRAYLWLLSREGSIPKTIINKYLKIAEDAGYDTSKLIWTPQASQTN